MAEEKFEAGESAIESLKERIAELELQTAVASDQGI